MNPGVGQLYWGLQLFSAIAERQKPCNPHRTSTGAATLVQMTAGSWAVVHHLGWDEVASGTCGGATYGDEKTRRVHGGNQQTTKNMVWWTMIIPSPQRTHPIFVGKMNDGVSPKIGQSPMCFIQSSDSYYWWTPHLLLGCPIEIWFPELRSKDHPFFGPRSCSLISLRLGICREWLVQQHVRLCWMSLGRG